jgi:carbamoyl-phosphate synthase large subunit
LKKILVTGCGGSAASNFIASLKQTKEKFTIIGTDTNKFHLELAHVDTKYVLPPASDPTYLEKINKIIEKEKIDLVHAQPDPEVLFLSRNREHIKTRLFLPSKQTIEICQNKMELLENFKNNQVPIAESYIVKSPKDLSVYFNKLIEKNKKVWLRAIRGAGARASLPINNESHGNAWIDYWETMRGIGYGQFMISEFLPGKEFAFQSIWKDGNLVTSQARERMEYLFGYLTPSGQTSSPSIARTIHREDVNEIATKGILSIDKNANGIFCVDLKENKTGTPCITEINAGRFFTTSNFFSTAGSNMPYYYIKMAFDEHIPELPKYNPIEKNLYWIRGMDMGYKLVNENKLSSKEL